MIVFLHGWLCRPSVFSHQINALNENYTIITPDYTDFVLAQSNTDSPILMKSINYIATLLKNITEPLILVGHSMGGVFTLELAKKFKYQVIGNIIIDTTMPNAPTTSEISFIKALSTSDGLSVLKDTLNHSMFNPDFDDQQRMILEFDRMISTWKQSPHRFTAQLAEAIYLDKQALIQQHHQPLCYISCQPPRGDVDAIKYLKSDTQFMQLNSGHFAMLNRPNEITHIIKTFADTLKNT